MTRNAEHRTEDTRVRDSAGSDLGIDHELTRGGRVRHEFWSCFPSELLLATADAQIETYHSVLVAGADEGNVAIEIVLSLNDLLRTL
jgi:hypothetical protein